MAEAPELHVDIPTLRRNYSSLSLLIVDTATQLLRELFLQILNKPTNTFFQKENVRHAIEDLFKKGVINLKERDYLLSHNVDAKKFDLSLLYNLLTTFFKKILRPRNGWTNDHDPNDYSTGGDLMRLRNVRNRYIAHSPNGRINEEEYKQLWEEVKGAILRIARTWLPDQEQSFRKQIDSIKTDLNVLYVFSDPLYMHPASASLTYSFAHFSAEKQQKQKKVLPACPSDKLEHLIVWSKQESKSTDDTVLPQIYPKLKLKKSLYVSFVDPSFAEGSPLKGTSDDPSTDPLTSILVERLKILEKCHKQDTAYTEETGGFKLKAFFSRDEPEKVSFVDPSFAEGSPLKGTSDDPSTDTLTLIIEDQLKILEKWHKQDTAYTEETGEFILKAFFIRDEPEKAYVSCPSDTEGSQLKGTSDDLSSDPLTLIVVERLKILEKWQKQDTAYTEETREFILKSFFSRDEPEKEYVSCPSDTEGSPLKGTSDETSLDPLPLTQEQRLQILHKWQEQDTAYTEETREFILKSCFSHDEPEKVASDCPSSAEDDMESIKSRRSPDDKVYVELTKLGTILADKVIGRLLSWAQKISTRMFPDEPGFPILECVKWNVFRISNRSVVLGSAFLLNPFYVEEPFFLTAGNVIAGCDEETVLRTKERFYIHTSPVGISSIENVGVLRLNCPPFQMPPFALPLSFDLGTETSTHIYVVGCVSGDQFHQIEECLVLPSRDNDDGIIRFKSELFSEGSFGSPCLVFKDGQFVLKGMLIGREEGTDTSYELIAITFRCIWKRLGLS